MNPSVVLAAALLCVFAPGQARAAADSVPDLSRHAVVLMFDDGWHSVFVNAFPLLRQYRMTASLPLISGAVAGGKLRYAGNASGYMNRSEVQQMIDELDVEIVSHSRTHPYLTKLDDAAVREELVGSRQDLEKMFSRPVTGFVYPYGDHDRRVRSLVAEAGYACARSTRHGTIDFKERPYDLPGFEARRTVTVPEVQHWVRNNPGLILFFHRIVPSPQAFTEWPVSRFAELLDWLDRTGVRVVTLGGLQEFYRDMPLLLALSTWRNRIEWALLEEVDVHVTAAAKGR